MTEVQKALFSMQDMPFQAFQAKLIPTVPPETIIGVRTPALRKLAAELSGSPQAEDFLCALPHRYFEENNLHAFLISRCGDFEKAVTLTREFLPYVDNWATCDQFTPTVFGRHLPELLPCITQWLASGQVYTVRFGIRMLMRFYLEDAFRPEYLDDVANVRLDDYYVRMMVAWYFATALAFQYNQALPYLQAQRLDLWVHNKTISKAIESYRITPAQKTYLRTLRRKQ